MVTLSRADQELTESRLPLAATSPMGLTEETVLYLLTGLSEPTNVPLLHWYRIINVLTELKDRVIVTKLIDNLQIRLDNKIVNKTNIKK